MLKTQPTRVPKPMREYLKAYAKYQGRKLDDLYAEILVSFLKQQPANHGLQFRIPQSSRPTEGEEREWVQINFFITEELNFQALQLANEKNVSKASVLYTALYWFVKYLRPPELDTTEHAAQPLLEGGPA